MIRVGIVGATGYTGAELLRLLCCHPEVQIATITSRSEAGVRVDSLYPGLRGLCDLAFVEPDPAVLTECDAVFFATPHGVAQAMMSEVLATGTRVIDLSADFRLRDRAVWEEWYQQTHDAPQLLAEAVYGLPEYHREAIRSARLVACPGCYPTAIQLGFLPLLEAGVISPSNLIANAASGVSGAGRGAKVANLFAEVTDSFKAYGASGHRHLPEIRQGLADIAGRDVDLVFVPHLAPMVRGIHATLYAELTGDVNDLQALFERRYADEPFVDVMPTGSHPETRTVKGNNQCRIAVHRPRGGHTVVVLAVIDNLTKGASGQAVQNLNIMFGLPEDAGLRAAALNP